MTNEIFINSAEALRRYGKSDLRTLKAWARKGYILYQVICPKGAKQEWYFESPEARYARTMGTMKI